MLFPKFKLIGILVLILTGWMINDLANNRETDPVLIIITVVITLVLLFGQGTLFRLLRGG